MMSRKHVGGKCCPAGKVKPASDNPVLAAFYADRKLSKERNSVAWKLSNAAVSNRRMLIGSGNLAAKVSKRSPQ